MNRQEHILSCLAEECCEVGQRVSKALRFGLEEIQPGQLMNNAERILEELHDLIAVALILQRKGVIDKVMPTVAQVETKWAKIEKFMAYAKAEGALTD